MSRVTSNIPTIFTFEGQQVRQIADEQGEPWFIAKDICDILDLDNVTKALLKIPEQHKGVNSIQGKRGLYQINTVDEPGLYRLILRSDKPQAEPFMEWVTAEVLPSIRKTGSYQFRLSSAPAPEDKAYLRQGEHLLREFQLAVKAAGVAGYKSRPAQLARGNEIVRERTGIDCLDYFGLTADEAVKSEQADGNLHWIDEFVGERCRVDPRRSVRKDLVYQIYLEWCGAGDIPPVSKQVFFSSLYKVCPTVALTRSRGSGKTRICYIQGLTLGGDAAGEVQS